VPEADHFFTGCITQMSAAIDGYLDKALSLPSQPAVARAR